MSMIRDDADLDGLPREERAMRLRIRNEIAASVAHIGESAAERAFRERTEAAKRHGIEVKERRDAEQGRWNALFDARFDQSFDQRVWPEISVEISKVIGETCDETLADAHKEMKEAVAKATAELRKEIAGLETRLRSTAGKLPAVKLWAKDCVAYEGELFSDGSNLYQARQTTGQQPGGPHWTCVARGADSVALPLPNLPAPDFDEEANALRAEFAAGFEKASGDLAGLERRVTSQQAVDRERLVRIEDAIGRIRVEARADAHAEFEVKLAERERLLEAKIATLEERLRSTAGRLPPVKMAWAEGDVIYAGQVLSYGGSLWQAKTDTGLKPGDLAAWVCVARAGRDGAHGRDGSSLTPRGVFDVKRGYAARDIVVYEGASYLALRDNPGLPGHDDGWMALSPRGEKGERGERGPRGSRGERGPLDSTLNITGWRVDPERYRAIPLLSNGQVGWPVELRSLFELYQQQTVE
jgi:hypothetical protein